MCSLELKILKKELRVSSSGLFYVTLNGGFIQLEAVTNRLSVRSN